MGPPEGAGLWGAGVQGCRVAVLPQLDSLLPGPTDAPPPPAPPCARAGDTNTGKSFKSLYVVHVMSDRVPNVTITDKALRPPTPPSSPQRTQPSGPTLVTCTRECARPQAWEHLPTGCFGTAPQPRSGRAPARSRLCRCSSFWRTQVAVARPWPWPLSCRRTASGARATVAASMHDDGVCWQGAWCNTAAVVDWRATSRGCVGFAICTAARQAGRAPEGERRNTPHAQGRPADETASEGVRAGAGVQAGPKRAP